MGRRQGGIGLPGPRNAEEEVQDQGRRAEGREAALTVKWYWWMVLGMALTVGVQLLARIPRQDSAEGDGHAAGSTSLHDLGLE